MIRRFWQNYRAVVSAITFAGAAAYATSFWVPIQLDGIRVIKNNELLHFLGSLRSIFEYDPSRFLTHLSFAANYVLHGEHVFGYHAVNFGLHTVNAVLVFFLLKQLFRLGRTPSGEDVWPLLGALIFAVHPVQTESVTYIVQRSVLLAAFFYLSALLLYVKLRFEFNRGLYVLLWLAVAGGVLSKPIFITLPVSAGLIEVFFLQRPRARMGLLALPFIFVLAAVPLLVLGFFLGFQGQPFDIKQFMLASTAAHDVGRSTYLTTQFFVWVRYLQLLVFPVNQTVYHALDWAGGFGEPRIFGSFFVHVVLLCAAAGIYRRNRVISFAVIWFYVLMIPEGSVFPLPDCMFEHRLYLAVIAFAAVLVQAAMAAPVSNKTIKVLLLVLIGVLLLLTVRRNQIWNEPGEILAESVRRYPQSAKAYNHLGVYFEQQEAYGKALEQFDRAVQRDPRALAPVLGLGRVYAKQQQWGRAKTYFDAALRLNPASYETLINLGDYYFRNNDGAAAVLHYKKALALKADQYYPLYKIGLAFSLGGRLKDGEEYLKKAVSLNPYYAEAYYSLGNNYLEQKRYTQAVEIYRKLLAMYPRYGGAYNTLGIAYVQLEEYRQAESCFLKAIELIPDKELAYRNLSQLYDKNGDKERAEIYEQMARKAALEPAGSEK